MAWTLHTWFDVFAHLDEVLDVVEGRQIVISVDDDDVDGQLSESGRSTAVQRDHGHVVARCHLAVHSPRQFQLDIFYTTTHLGHLQPTILQTTGAHCVGAMGPPVKTVRGIAPTYLRPQVHETYLHVIFYLIKSK